MINAIVFGSNVALAAICSAVAYVYGRWAYSLWMEHPKTTPHDHIYWAMVMAGIFLFTAIDASWWVAARLFDHDILDRFVGLDLDLAWFRRNQHVLLLMHIGTIGLGILALHAYCRIAYHRSQTRITTMITAAIFIAATIFFLCLDGTP